MTDSMPAKHLAPPAESRIRDDIGRLVLGFAVERSCPVLAVNVRWARYERGSSETQETET